MSAEQACQMVMVLNTLFVNKVITRDEMRAALKWVPLFGDVCAKSRAPKGRRK
jgi:hypothetical protein